MKRSVLVLIICITVGVISSCSSQSKSPAEGTTETQELPKYSLQDFYATNPTLDARVNEIISTLTLKHVAGQMIFQAAGRLGKPDATIEALIDEQIIGGVLLLNGSVEGFKQKIKHFDSLADKNNLLPILYSSDAEPSLINRKIEGSKIVPKTIELTTVEENIVVASAIAKELKDIGILFDYAPVLDISRNNAAIKNRSYGNNQDSVILLARAFANQLQDEGVAATIKHFPGHGLVKGDSHSKLVYLDGDMLEVDTYKPLIEAGVISVMIGHIAVKNNTFYNTEGMPASCSKKIIVDLLRNELGFKGIITTDAMNMGALKSIANVDFKAVLAGNDMILMPGDERLLITQIVSEAQSNEPFKQQIYDSVSRIIRLKLCLGILD